MKGVVVGLKDDELETKVAVKMVKGGWVGGWVNGWVGGWVGEWVGG